jgi:hypothetical protein
LAEGVGTGNVLFGCSNLPLAGRTGNGSEGGALSLA